MKKGKILGEGVTGIGDCCQYGLSSSGMVVLEGGRRGKKEEVRRGYFEELIH